MDINSKNKFVGFIIHKPFAPAKITAVYDSYWKFAAPWQQPSHRRPRS